MGKYAKKVRNFLVAAGFSASLVALLPGCGGSNSFSKKEAKDLKGFIEAYNSKNIDEMRKFVRDSKAQKDELNSDLMSAMTDKKKRKKMGDISTQKTIVETEETFGEAALRLMGYDDDFIYGKVKGTGLLDTGIEIVSNLKEGANDIADQYFNATEKEVYTIYTNSYNYSIDFPEVAQEIQKAFYAIGEGEKLDSYYKLTENYKPYLKDGSINTEIPPTYNDLYPENATNKTTDTEKNTSGLGTIINGAKNIAERVKGFIFGTEGDTKKGEEDKTTNEEKTPETATSKEETATSKEETSKFTYTDEEIQMYWKKYWTPEIQKKLKDYVEGLNKTKSKGDDDKFLSVEALRESFEESLRKNGAEATFKMAGIEWPIKEAPEQEVDEEASQDGVEQEEEPQIQGEGEITYSTGEEQPEKLEQEADEEALQEETAETPVESDETQVASDETPEASAETPEANDETQVASDETQVESDETQVASAETQKASAETQVASAETQVASVETQEANDETPEASAETQVASDEQQKLPNTQNPDDKKEKFKESLNVPNVATTVVGAVGGTIGLGAIGYAGVKLRRSEKI